MRRTQEIMPEMGSQGGAKEYEYDCQQRSRKRKAEEEGNDRRLQWAGIKRLASPILDETRRRRGERSWL